MTLKMKQIRRIARDYLAFFPDWVVLDRIGAIVRIRGPVLQGILFDRSSGENYHPTGFVRVLTAAEKATGVMELVQSVLQPPRFVASGWSVASRSHEVEMPDVVHHLYEQIHPSLHRPLDPHEVLHLYEDQIGDTRDTAGIYSVATLNAFLGYSDRARYWCDRYRGTMRDDPLDWEIERLHFLEQVETWMSTGRVQDELGRIVEQEREKLGIVSPDVSI